MKTSKKIILTLTAFLFTIGMGISDATPVYAYETPLEYGQTYTYTGEELQDFAFSFETSTTKKLKLTVQSLNGKELCVDGYFLINSDYDDDDYDDYDDYDYDYDDDYYDELLEDFDTTYFESTFIMNPGKCTLYITTYEDDTQFSICLQDVGTYTKSIKLSKSKLKMTVGDAQTLKAKPTPSNAMMGKITWKSSNKSVAEVSSNGRVNAKKLGKTIISAQLASGKTAKCTVYVNNDTIYLAKGKSKTVKLQNVSSKVSWKVKNSTIATVSKAGKVTAKKDGKTTITYKKDGISYTVNIIVTDFKELEKKARTAIKPYLKDPDSLKIYTTSRTTYDGKPALFISLGAKNSYGAYVRDYCWIYYNNQHKIKVIFL